MKKAVLLIFVLILSISLVACSGQTNTAPADNAKEGPSVKEQNELAKGSLIIGSTSAPRTLNPLYFPSRQDSVVTNLIFDNFVEPSENGEIVGKLVKSIELSEDKMTYTFVLNEGVKWHDGEAFDGDDVVATFELISHPDYTGGVERTKLIVGYDEFNSGEADSISGISLSEDKMTVTIKIKEPSATFLPGLYFAILPQHEIAKYDVAALEEAEFNLKPIGTGPFKFESWDVGISIKLSANESYYLGAPKLSGVIVKFGDEVALTTQLETGEIDLLKVNKDGIATFEGNDDVAIYSYPIDSVSYVGFRVGPGRAEDTKIDRPVFNKNIRQALAYATDKKTLVDAVYGENGYAHDSIFPKGSMGDSANDNQYNFDLSKAKSMIEAEGYILNSEGYYEKDGEVLSIELLYASSNTAAATIITEQWKQAGVKVSAKLLDFGALIQNLLRQSDAEGNVKVDNSTYDESTLATDSNFEAYLLGFSQESDPDEYAQYFVDNPSWNFYHYENEDVNQWFKEQAVETNFEKRKEILQKISVQITEDLPWFTYAGSKETVVVRSDLGGFEPTGYGYTMNSYNWYLK